MSKDTLSLQSIHLARKAGSSTRTLKAQNLRRLKDKLILEATEGHFRTARWLRLIEQLELEGYSKWAEELERAYENEQK